LYRSSGSAIRRGEWLRPQSPEVNHVSAVSMAGRPSVTNRVLSRTNVDFVSYSTCDSLDNIPNKIPRAQDYTEVRRFALGLLS
jgi:hypothetical protein